jgi:hypothetical protein
MHNFASFNHFFGFGNRVSLNLRVRIHDESGRQIDQIELAYEGEMSESADHYFEIFSDWEFAKQIAKCHTELCDLVDAKGIYPDLVRQLEGFGQRLSENIDMGEYGCESLVTAIQSLIKLNKTPFTFLRQDQRAPD